MRKEEIHRYIPIIILLALVFVSYLIIKSYIIALVSAFILAYLLYPVQKKLEKKMAKSFAAFLIIVGAFIAIFLPIILIIKEVVSQIYRAVQSGAISGIASKIESLEIVKTYNINIADFTDKFFQIGAKTLSSITVSVAASLVSMFVMIFTMYYLLLNWNSLSVKIKKYIPFDNKEKLVSDIADTTKKIVHGTLLIALLEAVAAAIGFWLIGNNFFLLLAALVGLFAFIPGGPSIVWVPVFIIELVKKSYLDAAIILLFGLFISVYLDTIFKTKVVGKNARVHPVIVLLGILGATPFMGLAGIVVGPLILSYTLEILEEVLSQH